MVFRRVGSLFCIIWILLQEINIWVGFEFSGCKLLFSKYDMLRKRYFDIRGWEVIIRLKPNKRGKMKSWERFQRYYVNLFDTQICFLGRKIILKKTKKKRKKKKRNMYLNYVWIVWLWHKLNSNIYLVIHIGKILKWIRSTMNLRTHEYRSYVNRV